MSASSADLRGVLAVIRAKLPVLIASAVVAAAAAFVLTGLQPRIYEAQATLIVGQSLSAVNPDYSQLLASQRLSTTYASVATTRPLLERVIQQLGLEETSEGVLRRVRAQAAVDSTLLTITAQDMDPAQAAALANAIAQELIAVSPAVQGRQADVQESVDRDLDATQAQIRATQEQVAKLIAITGRSPAQEQELRTLQAQLISLRATYGGLLPFSSRNASNQISVIQPAVIPEEPISPRMLINMMLAGVVGLFVAASLAFISQHLDDSVKDSDDLQEVAALPTLGAIRRLKGGWGRSEENRLAPLLYPRSQAAEAYRTLRTNIEFSAVTEPIRTLLVVSAVPAEGKTVTAANLALVFAQAGRLVLLVDADLRRPGVHRMFDLPNSQGLATMIRGDEASPEGFVHDTKQLNLRVLTSGPLPQNPAELLGSQRMRAIVDRLRTDYDLVIFDSPTLQAVADAAILSSFLDATLIVVSAGRTRRGALKRAREALAMADARVVGAVLNRVSRLARADPYDYSDYYREAKSGSSQAEDHTRGTREAPERTGNRVP